MSIGNFCQSTEKSGLTINIENYLFDLKYRYHSLKHTFNIKPRFCIFRRF